MLFKKKIQKGGIPAKVNNAQITKNLKKKKLFKYFNAFNVLKLLFFKKNRIKKSMLKHTV